MKQSKHTKPDEISQKTLLTLVIATLVVSLGGTFVTLNAVNTKLTSAGLQPITGFALIPNGTTTLTIQTSSSILFTQATVDFGTGNVNTSGGFSNCTLSTLTGPGTGEGHGDNVGCNGFNELSNGFTVENDGNTNLSVELRTNLTAAQFIGNGEAAFLWNVTVNETNSCLNISGRADIVNPNTTPDCASPDPNANNCGGDFESVSTTFKTVCPRLRFTDTSDALNIDINITIPETAPTGDKAARLIVRGTRTPLT